ncbi:MAG: alpha/beta hydrolase [Bacteroidetes bacterium]|nr:alpha/beta hydrolase [Rhodothermia bacterium]MCS7155209.1 alpha/beta hydrolase [Bacteroidota bacterium]MCX7907794.1 alpha/beta hydrolase [Bacteroidota bacterium]MDW8138613.1 alpha/beta hydrolase [Bacteroidota bacterium]MDW8284801.1 alpha/beta hydrolase [Bacteroidota bacterium]
MQQYLVNGLALHVHQIGRGPATVWIHGFPLDHRIWDLQAPLAPFFRLIQPDLRGFGQSQVSPTPYTIEELAQDVVGLLDLLGLSQAVVIGHSMGGYVALRLALRYRFRIRGLVLVCSQARADSEEARAGRLELVQRLLESGSAAVLLERFRKLFADRTRQQHPELVEAVLARIPSVPVQAAVHALLAMAERPDSRPFLGQISVPTLLIHGEEDVLIPVERSEEMARLLPNARLETIPYAAHMPMLEQPEHFNRLLDVFLKYVTQEQEAAE